MSIPDKLSLAKADKRTEGSFSPFEPDGGGLKIDTGFLYYRAAPIDEESLAPADQIYWWEGDGCDWPPGWYSTYLLGALNIPVTTRLSLTNALGI